MFFSSRRFWLILFLVWSGSSTFASSTHFQLDERLCERILIPITFPDMSTLCNRCLESFYQSTGKGILIENAPTALSWSSWKAVRLKYLRPAMSYRYYDDGRRRFSQARPNDQCPPLVPITLEEKKLLLVLRSQAIAFLKCCFPSFPKILNLTLSN